MFDDDDDDEKDLKPGPIDLKKDLKPGPIDLKKAFYTVVRDVSFETKPKTLPLPPGYSGTRTKMYPDLNTAKAAAEWVAKKEKVPCYVMQSIAVVEITEPPVVWREYILPDKGTP